MSLKTLTWYRPSLQVYAPTAVKHASESFDDIGDAYCTLSDSTWFKPIKLHSGKLLEDSTEGLI